MQARRERLRACHSPALGLDAGHVECPCIVYVSACDSMLGRLVGCLRPRATRLEMLKLFMPDRSICNKVMVTEKSDKEAIRACSCALTSSQQSRVPMTSVVVQRGLAFAQHWLVLPQACRCTDVTVSQTIIVLPTEYATLWPKDNPTKRLSPSALLYGAVSINFIRFTIHLITSLLFLLALSTLRPFYSN